jgi:HK97 family phage prohead protease
MPDLISLDRFRAELRAGAKPSAPVQRVSVGEPLAFDDGSRRIRFCFSDGSVDRMGDRIAADGWETAGFMKNPVALWAHDALAPPIGRAANVLVEGDRLMGDIEFAGPQVYPFAETIYQMVKGGFISAVSVGFRPIEYSFAHDKDREFGIDFERQELLEISVVPVPANAHALIEAKRLRDRRQARPRPKKAGPVAAEPISREAEQARAVAATVLAGFGTPPQPRRY